MRCASGTRGASRMRWSCSDFTDTNVSELIQHECGIAMVRLLKPLEYFEQHYGTPLWGFQKLFLLMEKQHNRGQDGAGIGCVKLNMPVGKSFMARDRELRRNPLDRMFSRQLRDYNKLVQKSVIFPEWPQTLKEHFDFGGEVLIGHLRYGTSGDYTKNTLHPYARRSNWPTRNLMLAGNFNMTNLDQLNERLTARGQHPIFGTDTQSVLEEIGFELDDAHDAIYRQMRDKGLRGPEIAEAISEQLDITEVLRRASEDWDGGYAMIGMIGNGDAFALRDPHGIRPCYCLQTEAFVAFASERVALMTVFDAEEEQVRELEPGRVCAIKHDGTVRFQSFKKAGKRASCSFERIYFSRGNDPEIYRERRALGAALAPSIFEMVEGDLGRTVLSYIPNTAETAYYGLLEGLRLRRRAEVKKAILEASRAGKLDEALLDEVVLNNWPRSEKIAHKDIKLRTFISQEKGRAQMVSHVYDITYGVVGPEDNLVCLDDSIVRGTTLKESILRMLSRTNPKRIIIASTAPQIRYPDCYGIDMSEFGKFIAFEAAVALLKETGRGELLREVYEDCIDQNDVPDARMQNHVARIYEGFSEDVIARKIGELLYPQNVAWKGELHIVYQRIEDLHAACPEHPGDWYFTGNYPTPGGYAVLNRAYINFYEKREGRSY